MIIKYNYKLLQMDHNLIQTINKRDQVDWAYDGYYLAINIDRWLSYLDHCTLNV